MTAQQQHNCDELLGFCFRCRVTYRQFLEAVSERMPHKTEEEQQYLLSWAAEHLKP